VSGAILRKSQKKMKSPLALTLTLGAKGGNLNFGLKMYLKLVWTGNKSPKVGQNCVSVSLAF